RVWGLEVLVDGDRSCLERWSGGPGRLGEIERAGEPLPDSAFLPGALAMGVENRACVDADPLLPRELLPQPWPGRAARELLVRSRRLALRLREAGGRPALFATYHDLVDALPGSGTAPGEGADGRQTRGGDT